MTADYSTRTGGGAGRNGKRKRLRIATRGSRLARLQAAMVEGALLAAHPALAKPEVVTVRTTGDRVRDRPLSEVGGKGVFTAEVDRVLLDGGADIAVHSMKDVETALADGIALAAFPEREDPRDAFISPVAGSIGDLPEGARVGTSSVRRRAQILSLRADLEIVPWRGNVDTRLSRLGDGGVAATLLALAGLRRMGLEDEVTAVVHPGVMLPAAGQGAIGVTCRSGDEDAAALLKAIDHGPTRRCVEAERAVLAVLDGSCRSPVAALARLEGAMLLVEAMVLSPDGQRWTRTEIRRPSTDPGAAGAEAGERLLRRAGRDLFGSRSA